MNPGTFKFIEQTLKDYKDIDRHIDKRFKALKYTVIDNAGATSERLAVTVADDLLLTNLKNIKDVVTQVLLEMEPEARRVIELYYIEQPRKLTWAGVADETKYSTRQCTNIRNAAFEQVAVKLGMRI